MTEELAIQQYPYSVKISQTSKGVRIDVHVYANNQEEVLNEIFQTYLKAKQMAMDSHIPLAPVENNK
jgi:hypothetical protein